MSSISRLGRRGQPPDPDSLGERLLLDERRERVIVQALPPMSQPPGAFVHSRSRDARRHGDDSQIALTGLGPAVNNAPNQPLLELNAREDAYFLIARREVDLAPGGYRSVSTTRSVDSTRTRAPFSSARICARLAQQFSLDLVGSWFQVKAPASPTLAAEVQRNVVTLSWNDPWNTTHFDLEVGSSSGLRNLLVMSLNGTSFTASGVPPGTYYLRLRAINEAGRSLPSQEITLVVPRARGDSARLRCVVRGNQQATRCLDASAAEDTKARRSGPTRTHSRGLKAARPVSAGMLNHIPINGSVGDGRLMSL